MADVPLVKVKFTADAFFENEGRGKGVKFKAGKTYEMTADQAQRWVRRDAAVLVDVEPEFPVVDDGGDADEPDEGEDGGEGHKVPNAGQPHAVPHPSQASPQAARARELHQRASAPKSEPKSDMTDRGKDAALGRDATKVADRASDKLGVK